MGKPIRIIFSVFCLNMLGLLIWRISDGMWSDVNWGMLLVAFVCCLLVFANFVYVFDYSYALCVALSSLLILWALPSLVSALMAGVGIAYGLRLFVFTRQRIHSHSYASRTERSKQEDAKMPVSIKVALWVQCALLHTFHLMALYYVAEKGVLTPGIGIGVAIMFFGTVIEAVADAQKQSAKAQEPNALVIRGLFSHWRHPNYAGEILFHVGLIVAGLAAADNWVEMIILLISPLYIVLLMISESQRVDSLHAEKYVDDAMYKNYRAHSGSLLPYV